MSEWYEFVVNGRARPQGSKRAVMNKHTGRVSLLESSSRHKHWRQLVALCAQNAATKPAQPIDGPVRVNLEFYFSRPKSHYKIRNEYPLLKMDAPVYATSRSIGDIDKLQRAVYDSITDAGWITDDSLIAEVHCRKSYRNDYNAADFMRVTVTPLLRTVQQDLDKWKRM